MTSLNNMSKSSTRGIFLSITLLFTLALITIPAYADEINVKSTSLEETTIIELSNDSDDEVNTFRIWLGSDFSFESFKTEKGWMAEKTPQGVIIFTSTDPIKSGESVKFGVKTNKVVNGINWKALDKKDVQLDTGKVLSTKIPEVVKNSEIKENQNVDNQGPSMTTESTFRIVPEKPNVGSSIRVTGDKFGASQEFDFYINSKKIGSFETDKDGHFMTSMKIPQDQKAERVDFKIKDKDGKEKEISLRIGEIENRIPISENVKLTIKGIPNIIHRGDFLEIFGTADPGSAITSTITNAQGEIINTRTAEVDSKGNWELEEPVIIPLDTPFGKYSAIISDGREEILSTWTVESDKVILIAPSSLKFELGETMKFSGTALPNEPIEILLEDPLGKEIFSDIIETDKSGFVEFEYKTEQTSSKGTYTIIATQEKEKEFIYTGLGELPTIPVNLEFDSLNYKAGDTANIALSGKASDVISLLIIDPSDKPVEDAISITLEPDGTGTYELDLTGYSSGVYTAVISKGSAQSTEIFTVGLQIGSGEIQINTTKEDYNPGDSILILGDTNPNVLLTVSMFNAEGDEIRIKETYSDKDGKISDNSFRIPSDAKAGKWLIKAQSGSNFDTTEIEVLPVIQDGMIIKIIEGAEIAGIGKSINIQVFGASQSVKIEITAEDGQVIEKLEFPSSSTGEINQPWIIPKDTEPGTYIVRAYDAFDSAESTFEVQ